MSIERDAAEANEGLDVARRRMLRATAGVAVLGAVALAASRAAAAGKISKDYVKYQYSPKGADHCSLCASFIANPEGGAGTCKLVEGAIQPNGWCGAFSPRR
ncbi:high-potential iron-sulfur protein [Caulobacter sp. KR2-114]|uniref:high-potential iron-sulfur protein n=1 Tax=Caulobacter sp. KR2-114 TaxID=3400912 RepID=UPI003C0EE695